MADATKDTSSRTTKDSRQALSVCVECERRKENAQSPSIELQEKLNEFESQRREIVELRMKLAMAQQEGELKEREFERQTEALNRLGEDNVELNRKLEESSEKVVNLLSELDTSERMLQECEKSKERLQEENDELRKLDEKNQQAIRLKDEELNERKSDSGKKFDREEASVHSLVHSFNMRSQSNLQRAPSGSATSTSKRLAPINTPPISPQSNGATSRRAKPLSPVSKNANSSPLTGPEDKENADVPRENILATPSRPRASVQDRVKKFNQIQQGIE